MTTTQTLIVTLTAAALLLYGLVAFIDTVKQARLDYQAKKDALRLAAIAERHRIDFERDHPDRTRVGLTEEE